MTKLDVNFTSVQNTVYPRLSHARSYLNSANQSLSGASIPSSYGGASELRQIANDIKNIEDRLKKFENFLESSSKNLTSKEEDNLTKYENIEEFVIQKRVSPIRGA